MQKSHTNVRKDLLRQVLVHLLRGLHGLRFLDHRVYDVSLPALRDLLLHEAVHAFDAIVGDVPGLNGPAAGRHFIDDGNIQIAINGERQRARDGSGGHHENVGMLGLRDQAQPLHDAEAVLFVDDRQAQVLPFDILFDQRVRSDADMGQPFGHQLLELRFFALRRGAGEENRHVAHFVEQVLEIEIVLAARISVGASTAA